MSRCTRRTHISRRCRSLYRFTPARERRGRYAARGLADAAAAQRDRARRRRKSDRARRSALRLRVRVPARRAEARAPAGQPYRLPYALSSAVRVSQAYPGHEDAHGPGEPARRRLRDADRHDVFAARDGIVIEVASDFFESGTDMAVDGPRANVVRVLHDDGTMALYVHLNWNTIRVVPGQRVEPRRISRGLGQHGLQHGAAPALRRAAQPWRRARVGAGGVCGRGRRLDHRAGGARYTAY